MLNKNGWFRFHEKYSESSNKRINLENKELDIEKDIDMLYKEGRLTKRF
jgi:hypothetical protein